MRQKVSVLRAADLQTTFNTVDSVQGDGSLTVEKGVHGYVLYGPYIPYPDGIYNVKADFAPFRAGTATIDVYSNGVTFGAGDLSDTEGLTVYLKDATAVEFRIKAKGKRFNFKQLTVWRVGELLDPTSLPDAVVIAASNQRFASLSDEGQRTENEARTILDNLPRPTGKGAVAKTWVALHAHAPENAIKFLSQGTSIEDVSEWVAESTPTIVIEAWGDLGVLSEDYLSAHGFLPSAARLAAADRLMLESLYAALEGEAGLVSVLEKQASQLLKRNIKSSYLAKLAEMESSFQKSGLLTGRVFCLCPISGALLRSAHAIPVPFDLGKQTFIFYYFESVEPFYLVAGGWSGAKIFIYYPGREIILRLQDPLYNWGPPQDAVNQFKRLVLGNPTLVSRYLSSTTCTALLSATVENLGHFFWNDLTGLITADRLGLLENVTHGISYKHDFIDPFAALKAEPRIERIRCSTEAELFDTVLSKNLFCVRPTELLIDDETADRVEQLCRIRASREQLEAINRAKTAPYLIWINLRAHNKVLMNQTDVISTIITDLAHKKNGLAVFIDGTPDCLSISQEIKARAPSNVEIFQGLDLSLYDSISWAFAVDTYIATIGSGLTLVTWLAQKLGVAHSERAHLAQMEFWGDVRPNAPLPFTPQTSDVTDLGEGGGYCDYEIEPIVISKLVEIATGSTAINVASSLN